MKQAPLIGQVLSQRQSAILAPQLQQGVRMLQLSSIELHEELELALQQNPFLEKLELDTEFDYVESKSDQPESVHVDIKRGNTDSGIIQGTLSQPFFRSPVREGSTAAGIRPDTAMAAGYGPEPHMTDEPGLQEYLRQQAAIAGLTSRQRFIMELLIDSVNDRGYLRASLKEIVQLAMPEYVVTEKQVAGLLKILQGFDPVGVGARNSRECLLLQLDDLRADSDARELARLIVKSYLIQLAKGDYLAITEKTGRSEAEVRESIGLIRQLNPFPGDSIGSVSVTCPT